MKYQCASLENISFKRVRGRIYIRKKDESAFSEEELKTIREGLHRCAGLESFSPALECKPDMTEICSLVTQSIHEHFDPILAVRPRVEFRVRARRSDKSFPLCSRDIEIAVATHIEAMFGEEHLRVNLTHAEVTVGIEVRDVKKAICTFKREYMAPGEMEHITVPEVLLEKAEGAELTVMVKPQEPLQEDAQAGGEKQ